MRLKTTLVLLALTIGIGAYISLYEIKQPSPEEREQRSKQILTIAPETVTQVTVELPAQPASDGQPERPALNVTLNREGAGWTLAPKGLRANAELANNILSGLSPLVADRILTNTPERPLDPAAYGLQPARGTLSIIATDSPTTVWFGDTTAVQQDQYLKLSNRPEIFIVSSSLFNTLNVPAEQFRDAMLLQADTWTISRLIITSPQGTLELTQQDTVWKLEQPINDRADRNEVNSLLSQLTAMRIAKFVDDEPPPEQPAQWGFDQPKAKITIYPDQASEPVTIVFGKTIPEETALVYAQRSDAQPLYAVAASEVETLLRDPNSLRSTAGLEGFPSAVSKVEVVAKGSPWTIEQQENQWRETASQTVLDAARVMEWLNKLLAIRLSGFVEDGSAELVRYGLEPATEMITVWTTDASSPQRVLVGTTIGDTTERYGRIEGRDAVVRLPAMMTELLATNPEQFRPTPEPPPTPQASPAPATTPPQPASH